MIGVITGGCGFAGSHLVEHFLKNTDHELIIFDKLSYASNGFKRLKTTGVYGNDRVKIMTVDLTRPVTCGVLEECGPVDYIIHMAAETHVDRSIEDAGPFIYNNYVGTYNILEYAKKLNSLKAFCYFSTDEVYGPAEKGVFFKEEDRYNCTNPYSSTKAASEQLVLSYFNCYRNLNGFIINCMNLFGEMQHYEKFIPLCIRKILLDETITIHGNDDCSESGSRYYLHARNAAACVLWLLSRFKNREKYNLPGELELTNLEIAKKVSDIIGKDFKYQIISYCENRPGHDFRYAIDGKKLSDMGYTSPINFNESLERMVRWTLNHRDWIGL